MKTTLLRYISLLLALLLTLTGLAGCFGRDDGFELRCPLAAEPKVLDPQIAEGGEASTVIANCFEGLMRLNTSEAAEPAMAEKIGVSADGLVYTFTIRDGCSWHVNSNHEDIFGEDYETAIDYRVKAEDFVFGLQRALMPQTASPGAKKLYMIKNARDVHEGKLPVKDLGVRALDERTVEITLEYTGSDFLHSLTEPAAMPCCKAFFEATKGKYGLDQSDIICNGPFYLSYWTKGTSILLRRNPDNAHFKAKPTAVTFAFTDDSKLIRDNLIEGYYAAAPLDKADVKEAKNAGAKITRIENTVTSLVFNCAADEVNDPDLRIALIQAMDFTAIRSAGAEASSPANCLVPPSCVVDGKSYVEIAKPIGLLASDKAHAKQLYDKHTDGAVCSVTVLCGEEYETAVRGVIQGWQQTFGISLAAGVEVLDEKELKSRVASGDYQCAIAPVTTLSSTPLEFLESFEHGGGICRFESAEFDMLIDELRKGGTAQDVADRCAKAQLHMISSGVICPLFYTPSYYGEAKDVTGTGYTHAGSVLLLYGAEKA